MHVLVYISYGLPERQQDLSAENVEVVCRSRAVHNNPVTVIKLMHGKVFRQFLPTYNEVKKTNRNYNTKYKVLRGRLKKIRKV